MTPAHAELCFRQALLPVKWPNLLTDIFSRDECQKFALSRDTNSQGPHAMHPFDLRLLGGSSFRGQDAVRPSTFCDCGYACSFVMVISLQHWLVVSGFYGNFVFPTTIRLSGNTPGPGAAWWLKAVKAFWSKHGAAQSALPAACFTF